MREYVRKWHFLGCRIKNKTHKRFIEHCRKIRMHPHTRLLELIKKDLESFGLVGVGSDICIRCTKVNDCKKCKNYTGVEYFEDGFIPVEG